MKPVRQFKDTTDRALLRKVDSMLTFMFERRWDAETGKSEDPILILLKHAMAVLMTTDRLIKKEGQICAQPKTIS
jgi:hypothetical protein